MIMLARFTANFSYWPVVDSYAEDPFLPVDPLEALMTGMFTRVPFISGTVLYEVLPSSQWHALHQCYFLTGLLGASLGPAARLRCSSHHRCAAQDQLLHELWTGD